MNIQAPLRSCRNHGDHSRSCGVKDRKNCVLKSGLVASLPAGPANVSPHVCLLRKEAHGWTMSLTAY